MNGNESYRIVSSDRNSSRKVPINGQFVSVLVHTGTQNGASSKKMTSNPGIKTFLGVRGILLEG